MVAGWVHPTAHGRWENRSVVVVMVMVVESGMVLGWPKTLLMDVMWESGRLVESQPCCGPGSTQRELELPCPTSAGSCGAVASGPSR